MPFGIGIWELLILLVVLLLVTYTPGIFMWTVTLLGP